MAERLGGSKNGQKRSLRPFTSVTKHEQRQRGKTDLDNENTVENINKGQVKELAELNIISVPDETNVTCVGKLDETF